MTLAVLKYCSLFIYSGTSYIIYKAPNNSKLEMGGKP